MRVEVEIPFMTAIFGGTENINIRRLEECKTCSGSGKKPDARINPCSLCSGQGVIEKLRTSPFGGMSKDLQMCPNCRGSGENVEDYCHICQGKGAIFETKEVLVHIPAGVEAGVTLRVRDSGNGGKKGGARGDLFVQLAVRKDSKFRREGIDIYTTEVISCFDAILGTTIRVDTVDGKIEVNIPMGTQPDQKIRIQGKGVPQLGSVGRGHAFLIMKVKIPTSISSKERELVEQIAELCGRERKDDSFSGLTDSN